MSFSPPIPQVTDEPADHPLIVVAIRTIRERLAETFPIWETTTSLIVSNGRSMPLQANGATSSGA
jgi:hypothetical protein